MVVLKHKLITLLLTLTLILPLFPATDIQVAAESISSETGQTRGIFLDPTTDGLSGGVETKIDSTIAFMIENNMNTIYFKIDNNFAGDKNISNLLDYTIEKAESAGIATIAWIDTCILGEDYTGSYGIEYNDTYYRNITLPESVTESVEEIKEIVKRYDIDILVDTRFYPSEDFDDKLNAGGGKVTTDELRAESISEYVEKLSGEISSTEVGVIVNAQGYGLGNGSYTDTSVWFSNGWIDYAVPVMDMTVNASAEDNDFSYYANRWHNEVKSDGLDWMPLLSSSKVFVGEFADPMELSIQMFYAFNSGAKGVLFDSADIFISEEEKFDEPVKRVADHFYDGEMSDGKIDADFIVTRPDKEIEVTSEYYYMMGISDPNADLTCNGEEVDYRGKRGTFGHYVMLDEGDNVYRFSQPGEEDQVVTITYSPTGDGKTAYIDEIVQNTMDPVIQDIAYVGREYIIECVAPAGAKVVAEVAYHNVILEQVDDSKEFGAKAVYRGRYTVHDVLESNYVKKMDKVTYTLEFDGVVTEYEANGDLYVAYPDNDIRIRAKNYMTTVFETESIGYQYNTIMNVGTESIIKSQTPELFGLEQGGFVKKDDVEILFEVNDPNDKVKDVRYVTSYNSEKLIFEGAENTAYRIDEDGDLTVELFNIVGISERNTAFDIMKKHSKLFKEVVVEADENSVTMKFVLKKGQELWGYSFDYDGENSILYFRKKPKLSTDKSMPLKDITVVLDPGHGGSDPGAQGPPAFYGPVEKDVTLMIALETKDSLEKLGATVLMTRSNDKSMELYSRAAITDRIKPDFFMSIHLNSVAEVSDGGKADGIEVYYVTPQSEKVGENVIEMVNSYTGRKMRETIHGVYVVARPTSAPSVLCEIGFMSNPEQYEEMINATVIDRTGDALAKSIEQSLR